MPRADPLTDGGINTETPYTQQFWDALRDDRFLIHSCEACGHQFFPPAPVCPTCQSWNVDWAESNGVGSIYSFTKQYVTAGDFEQPIVAGVIELDDNPRLLTPIDADYEQLTIGDRAQLVATEYENKYDRGQFNDYPYFIARLIEE